VLIPGGFGVRGIEGKIGAIRYAREHGIPILGLCLGLQCMVIEVARDLAGLADADSAEFNPDTPYPVIATMADQEDVVAGERDMGGTMRLGLYPALAAAGHQGERAVRHHRWSRSGTGTGTRSTTPTAPLEQAGLVFSGLSPDGHLVEFAELPPGTRSSSPPRRIRSSCPARPGRIRCSAG
jgi:CTP synthase